MTPQTVSLFGPRSARVVGSSRLASNLHYLGLFGRQDLINLLDIFRRILLYLDFGDAQIVIGNLLFLVQFAQHLVGVAAMVADRYAKVLAYLADVLDEFLAPLFGQGALDEGTAWRRSTVLA